MTRTIALVTCEKFPELFEDDRLLQRSLRDRGAVVEAAVWSDARVDWGRFGLAIVRSTWDYHRRYPEFLRWIASVSERTRLWNPPSLLRWNTHKSYLGDLQRQGVPIIPTEWVTTAGDALGAAQSHGWRRFVVKPAVSANAENTAIVSPEAPPPSLEPRGPAGWMVQPYVDEVEVAGERSLIFLDGTFSHAVQRKAALNPAAGLVDGIRLNASEGEVALGRRALAAVPGPWLYARVDTVTTGDGVPRLMELELTEPLLYLGVCPGAADRLAESILARPL